MRKQLRRQLALKIKALGLPSRLYRGSKFQFYRRFSTRSMVQMLDRLALSTPGAVVEDCDSFNHVVRGIRPGTRFRQPNKWWYGWGRGYFFDFTQVEFEDGRWSCGCPESPCPPSSRDEIEQGYLRWCEENNVETALDDFTQLVYPPIVITRLHALREGMHITDARGVLLAEFAKETR